MHLSDLRLRDFRNYARLDASFSPGFHLFLGNNAQGKTNLLEALYLLATLRSFRGVVSSQMVRHQQKGWFVSGKVVGEGSREIKLYWSSAERKIAIDGRPVRKMAEFIGVFRAVVFCSEDQMLVKGPSTRRRRYLDLILSQTQPGYLPLLQRYTQALRSRNALLKQRSPDLGAMEGFTHQLAELGAEILVHRARVMPTLAKLARECYARVSHDAEPLSLEYRSTVKDNFLTDLRKSRDRERTMRTTVVGPHRDELSLALNQKAAAQFASEGQKRSIALSLKMAQAEILSEVHGVPPVLLIDDVMGELDARRRAGFLPLLERVHRARSQVFMTCTEENWPEELGRRITRWNINTGAIKRV